jgi:ATP-binding cassette subfamily B protein
MAWVAKTFQLDAVNRLTRGVGIQLYGDAIRHSLGMPYSAFEDRRSGEIVAMIQTARYDTENFLTVLVNTGFSSAVGVVFVIVYAARVNWMLAPAFLLIAPVIGFVSYLLGGEMREAQRRIVSETSRLSGSAAESLHNIEIVKGLGLANQEVTRLNEHGGRILEIEVEKIRHARFLTFFHGACVNLLRSGLLLLLLYLVFTKQITMGQFFSLVFYSYFIFSPMQEMGNVTTLHQQTMASLNNMSAILDAPQEQRPLHPVALGPIESVSFREVTFQYPAASEPAVRDVSFQVARGETIAFVGPSGSGKTTLVKLLAGLYPPQSGVVSINNIPLAQIDPDLLRQRIGLVTQDTRLFSGTIRDNLVFVKADASDQDCLDALRQAAVTGLMAHAPNGLDTIIGESGLKVSGGERQRISIARALLRNPELLVFDEATSSLDAITEEEIVQTMKSVSRRHETITVIISHRLSTARHADRIYVLNNVLNKRSIVETGTHADLVNLGGLYFNLWRQQTGGAIAQTAV